MFHISDAYLVGYPIPVVQALPDSLAYHQSLWCEATSICLRHENDLSASALSTGSTDKIQSNSRIFGKKIGSASWHNSCVTDFSSKIPLQCTFHQESSLSRLSSAGNRCFHLDFSTPAVSCPLIVSGINAQSSKCSRLSSANLLTISFMMESKNGLVTVTHQ